MAKAKKSTRPADERVNTTIESVGATARDVRKPSLPPEPESAPGAPSVAEPEPAAETTETTEKPTKAAQDAAAAPQRTVRGNLIPLVIFCRLKGKADQTFAFLRFGKSQRWGRRTIEEWNKTWDDFQKREIK